MAQYMPMGMLVNPASGGGRGLKALPEVRRLFVPAELIREIYPEHAIKPTPAFPGVAEALAAVRRHEGRIVLTRADHGRLAEGERAQLRR